MMHFSDTSSEDCIFGKVWDSDMEVGFDGEEVVGLDSYDERSVRFTIGTGYNDIGIAWGKQSLFEQFIRVRKCKYHSVLSCQEKNN